MKKMGGKRSKRKQSRRGLSRRKQSRRKQSKRKNKNTKRKMRGGSPFEHINNKKKNILETCLEACKILQPFVQMVYELLNYERMSKEIQNKYELSITGLFTTKKNITDVFTITDGMVQYILRNYLFNDPEDFVGEENITVTKDNDGNYVLKQGNDPPIEINPIFTEIINKAIEKIKDLAIERNIDETNFLKNYTIFVDPIDGTAEYQGTDKRSEKEKLEKPFKDAGEQATIMIGFADIKTGNAVGGIIYRPVENDKKLNGTYAYGWVDTIIYKENLDMNTEKEKEGKIRFITSNGSVSNPTLTLITNIEGKAIGSGGAGNKILMLLENKADVYLQDRGVSRWDTCAGEAILRAKGGLLCKLTEFETTGKTDSRYTYKKVDENPDPNQAASKIDQNSIIDDESKDTLNKLKEEKELLEISRIEKNDNKDEINKIKKQINELIENKFIKFNPMNNLCGMVAITGEKKEKGLLDKISKAIKSLPTDQSTGLKFDYN